MDYRKFMIRVSKCISSSEFIAIESENREMTKYFIFFFSILVAYDESFQYLAKANSKSKWSLDLYFKYAVKWFGISMILASLGSVALCRYMHGEIIKKYLYHPHRFV